MKKRIVFLLYIIFFLSIDSVEGATIFFGGRTFENSNDATYQNDSSLAVVQTGKVGEFLTFSGFIKYDMFWDIRQTVNAREALVTLYPQDVLFDGNGRDVNLKASFNMLSIHSRIRCNIEGPAFLGARSSGIMEADFYGNENKSFSDLNGLRLFNAYMKFNWRTTQLLIGQDWHPMSTQGFFPKVVSFSAGAPFHPMSRNPQVTVQQKMGELKVIGSLLAQRDFTGTGPEGPGSHYLRNSGLPNLHLQVQYGGDTSTFRSGIGLDYKKIVPELFTSNEAGDIFSTKNALSSVSAIAFIGSSLKSLTFKLQGVYAQNAYDQLMIGGYAVSRIINAETGEKLFANLNTASIWTDLELKLKKINFGLFGGFTENLGSQKIIEGAMYSRGENIKSVTRISPRLVYSPGAVSVSLEGEFTTANYGKPNSNNKGQVTDTQAVSNFRSLVSMKYSF
ncbi:hypothetical protein [uncultured Arcticibacterium sp.]|uniref:hypothetical protein n=1 Tax=uncultured Arcticibacterium sp. TaxID=2173042 RepID=UPI0030F7565C